MAPRAHEDVRAAVVRSGSSVSLAMAPRVRARTAARDVRSANPHRTRCSIPPDGARRRRKEVGGEFRLRELGPRGAGAHASLVTQGVMVRLISNKVGVPLAADGAAWRAPIVRLAQRTRSRLGPQVTPDRHPLRSLRVTNENHVSVEILSTAGAGDREYRNGFWIPLGGIGPGRHIAPRRCATGEGDNHAMITHSKTSHSRSGRHGTRHSATGAGYPIRQALCRWTSAGRRSHRPYGRPVCGWNLASLVKR